MGSQIVRHRIGTVVLVLTILVGVVVLAIGFLGLNKVQSAPMPETTFTKTDPDTYAGPTGKEAERLIADLSGPMVSIPSIDVGAELVKTGAVNGWLTLPEPPAATWYEKTVELGSEQGRTLIASHVDSGFGDQAPFSRLHSIEKGAPIFVRGLDGKMHSYRATDIQVYERTALPDNLFSRSGRHELVLVTCSGPTVTSGEAAYYLYNLVVIAEPIQ